MKQKIFLKNGKNTYVVYENGDIVNVRTNRLLKPLSKGNNYKRVSIYGVGKFYIHRILANAFIPNPDNLPIVNHIDGDRTNNSLENLEWCTYSENTKNAIKRGTHNMLWLINGLEIIRYMRNSYSDDEISKITGVDIDKIMKVV